MTSVGPQLAGTQSRDTSVGTLAWSNNGYLCVDNGNTDSVTTGSGCFIHGTMVATPRGDVAIESLSVGDQVFAFDGSVVSVVTIQAVIDDNAATLWEITAGDDSIICTPGHPIFCNSEFIPAATIKSGDSLIILNDGVISSVTVSAVAIRVLNDSVPVRTLTVDSPNTFFSNNIGVHNK